jgi:hypothetical protein
LSFPRCLLHAARCPLHVAYSLLRCMSFLFAAYCTKSCACCSLLVARCMSFVVRCMWHEVWRMLAGCCLLRAACRLLSVAHLPVVSCTLSLACRPRHCRPLDRVCVHVLRRMPHVLRCLFSGARPSVPCRMVCAVCRLVPRRISSRRMCCVVSRLLHVA